jgi:hypothetical protein
VEVAPLLEPSASGDQGLVVVGPAEHDMLAIGDIAPKQNLRTFNYIHVLRLRTEVKCVLGPHCKNKKIIKKILIKHDVKSRK